MKIKIYSAGIHRGEERQIKGNTCSGLVTFSGCHLKCSFCYTPETSIHERGADYNTSSFTRLLAQLHSQGAQNINLISPTHLWEQIEAPLRQFKANHPLIPIILKVSGFESISMVRRFSQVADVFVPDFKVWDSTMARRANIPPLYGRIAQKALAEMKKSHSPTQLDSRSQITRGILVRHLLMPDHFLDSTAVIHALKDIEFTGHLNLMTYFLDKQTKRMIQAPPEEVSALANLAADSGIVPLVNGNPWGHPSQRRETQSHAYHQ